MCRPRRLWPSNWRGRSGFEIFQFQDRLYSVQRARIFISYRREDATPYAQWIYNHLSAKLGQEQVFFDKDTIPPGEDFVEFLNETVSSCGVLLAIIGKSWLTVADASGRPRIHNPEDFVAIEIKAALHRGIRVIPILVGGAQMPQTGDMPEALWPLARKQACELADKWFINQLNGLIPLMKPGEPACQNKGVSNRTDGETLKRIRRGIVDILSARYQPLFSFNNSRAMHWSADKSTRVVIPISKERARGNFSYHYGQRWVDFLAPAERGFYVLACVERNEAFAIPVAWLRKIRATAGTAAFSLNVRPDATTGEIFLHLNDGKRE